MTIAKKRIINNMFTKNFWLLIGALTVLCAVGVNTYLSKKPAPAIETPEEITEESAVAEPEESTSTVPKEISLNPEIDTSDWETYRNEEYGFEIEYPTDWYIRKAHGWEAILFLDVDETKAIAIGGVGAPTDYYRTGKERTEDPTEWVGVQIVAYERPSDFSWDKWLKKNFPIEEYEIFILNGLQCVKITKLNGISRGGVFISNENRIYNIAFINRLPGFDYTIKREQGGLAVFNQMLSTFKIIE